MTLLKSAPELETVTKQAQGAVATPRVLMMAGGTGGHIFPALETANGLIEQGYDVQWLGTSNRMEADIVPKSGITLHFLTVRGLRKKGLFAKAAACFYLLLAVVQAIRLLRRLKPALVIGMGGYASAPGGLAAWLLGLPLLIHEQNSIPGLTNRLLSRLATKTLTGFPGVLSARGGQYVGNPVRREITALPAPKIRYEKRDADIRILIIGGSLGASALNRMVPEALSKLNQKYKLTVYHQTGKTDQTAVSNCYHQHQLAANVVAFIDNMASAYAWADLVICRSGALTVSEIAAIGVAALFVPYPHAVDDHQFLNAKHLVEQGAAELIVEKQLTVARLFETLEHLCVSRTKLLQMAQKARQSSRHQAAENVVYACMEIMNEYNNDQNKKK